MLTLINYLAIFETLFSITYLLERAPPPNKRRIFDMANAEMIIRLMLLLLLMSFILI